MKKLLEETVDCCSRLKVSLGLSNDGRTVSVGVEHSFLPNAITWIHLDVKVFLEFAKKVEGKK